MKRAKRIWLFYNLALLLFALAIFVYLGILRMHGLLFLCPFSFLFHLYCPGCGFTRALRALLRLDLVGALLANPMAIWLLLTLLYYEVALFLAFRRGGRVSRLPAIVFAYALVGYAVLRNLLLTLGGIDPLGDLIRFWR